jgi:hypothetical protein
VTDDELANVRKAAAMEIMQLNDQILRLETLNQRAAALLRIPTFTWEAFSEYDRWSDLRREWFTDAGY